MNTWKTPGLALAIVKDGKVLMAEGFGLRNLNQNLPVTPETLFPIASCTKTFTALSIAILVDEGKLDWDVPVKEYVPFIRFFDDYTENHITLRDLLTHRSGLPQHYYMYFNRHLTRDEIIERLKFLEPGRGFREVFQYSNLNYVIAAYIMEKVNASTWESFVKERIFAPLEMKKSNFIVSEHQNESDFALPYREENGKVKQTVFLDPNIMGMGPAGAINSNATDLTNWLLFNLNNGKYKDRQIISEAKLKEIQRPQIMMPGNITDERYYSSYGMGWGITSYRGHLLLAHGGGFNGFSSYVSVLPRDNIGIAILCNLENSVVPQILSNIIFDRLLGLSELPWNDRMKAAMSKIKRTLQEIPGSPDQESKPSRPLKDYCGDYEHPAYGVLTVKKEKDRLSITHHGVSSLLVHLFYDIFETKDAAFGRFRFSFISDDEGKIDSLEVPFEPATRKIKFNRKLSNKELYVNKNRIRE